MPIISGTPMLNLRDANFQARQVLKWRESYSVFKRADGQLRLIRKGHKPAPFNYVVERRYVWNEGQFDVLA
jgi:hypothetical protein